MTSESICTAGDQEILGELPVSLMTPGVSASSFLLQRVLREIAATDIPVLVLGERGTGKEVVASEIHRLSPRCKEPLIKFSCSSLDLQWLLSTLVRKAGNGIGARPDGTVLLDEVNQLDLGKQESLLSLLCDSERAVPVTCLTSRLISTSTKDLVPEMRGGSFLEELYFRLNGFCLRIPPLRQRREDIPLLFTKFLAKYAKLLGRQEPQVKSSTMDLLMRHSWPGNVRELEDVARKVVMLGDEELAVSDLATSAEAKLTNSALSVNTPASPQSLKQAAREASRKAERQLILESLQRTHWNRKRSARELQISYKAMLYKLKQLGLDGTGSS